MTEGQMTEFLLNKWEARREIQNLMARYTTSLMLKREPVIYADFWADTDTACYGCNEGYYVGADVKRYYEALDRKNILRTDTFRKDFPDEYQKMSDEEAYGAGVLNYKPLSNPIIEIADDLKTGKGFWYVMGMYDEATASGPLSFWTWGMFAGDFIQEDGAWKIWHLLYLEDVNHPCGESWGKEPKEREAIPLYDEIAAFTLPEPTVPTVLRELYRSDRPFAKTPRLPEPYATFAETFSYGI